MFDGTNVNGGSSATNGVSLDSATIRQLGKDIITETEKLLMLLENEKAKVDGSISAYDAPAAVKFRQKMEEFTLNAKNGSNKVLTNLSNYFEKVAALYENVDDEIAKVADQYLSTDIFGNIG